MDNKVFADAVRVAISFLEGLNASQLKDLANGQASLQIADVGASPVGGTQGLLWENVRKAADLEGAIRVLAAIGQKDLQAHAKALGAKRYSSLRVDPLRQLVAELIRSEGAPKVQARGAANLASLADDDIPDPEAVRRELMSAETREAATSYLHSFNLKKAALSKLAKALNIRTLSNASPDEIVAKIVATTTGGRIKAEVLQSL